MRNKHGERIALTSAAEINKHYSERAQLFKDFGYDIEKEINFVIEKAQPLYGNILEIGTGKGHFALELAKEGYCFTSVDISEEAQEYARMNMHHLGLEKYVEFKIENAERLSFKNKSFDVIFSINTLHHLENLYRVLDEMKRVLSLEGKIILTDFTKAGRDFITRIHKEEGRIHSKKLTNFADIEHYFKKDDFRIEKYKSTFQELLIAYHYLM